jgi:hypothetical protein
MWRFHGLNAFDLEQHWMAAIRYSSAVKSGTTACLASVCMHVRLATQGKDHEVDEDALVKKTAG